MAQHLLGSIGTTLAGLLLALDSLLQAAYALPMPRTRTTKARIWTTDAQTVIRIPLYLKERVHEIARHLDQGGEVQLVPIPDLFTPEPKSKKPKKPAKELDKPKTTTQRKRKPVTG